MIELDKLEYSHKSMMDDFGRVFFYEDRVYRAISNTSKEECLELLNSELFQILISKSLIPRTQITDFKLPDYDLILEHEKLLEIQQHEWSFEMSKKAALTVIEINNICNQFGYELKDAHTFNILFRGLSPVFVDIGSIVKRSGSSWIAMKEFICTFYLPLAFWSQSEMFIVRKLVESNFYKLQTVPNQDIFESKLLNLLSKKPYSISLNINKYTLFKSNTHLNIFVFFSLLGNKFLSFLFKKNIKAFKYEIKFDSTEEVRKKIELMHSKKILTEWSGYHQENYLKPSTSILTYRFSKVLEIIKEYENEIVTAIDLAGNEGIFTEILLQYTSIKRIILTDFDNNVIDYAFNKFKNYKDNRISTAVLNFIFTLNILDTSKRFKSDLVVALAVTHHLMLTQKYSLDVILERLLLYSNRYVLVEFMPLGLWSKNNDIPYSVPVWYNECYFESKFKKYFNLITKKQLEENRIVYFGRIK